MSGITIDENNGGWKDQSIQQPDIVAAQDPKFVKDYSKYNVSNPHPEYGSNPNIINEFGHTAYPKMVYPKGPDEAGVIVNSESEEVALMGKEKKDIPKALGDSKVATTPWK